MEMSDLAACTAQFEADMLVVSDHGMIQVGSSSYGDHADAYGYWASNFVDFGTPKLTDFGVKLAAGGGV